MADLPRPVTGTEMYLAALLSELRDLRTQIEELSAQRAEPMPTEGPADLREPAQVGESIPDDFPGAVHLRDAGIFLLKDIPRSESYLRDIDGIGSVTARKILEALNV